MGVINQHETPPPNSPWSAYLQVACRGVLVTVHFRRVAQFTLVLLTHSLAFHVRVGLAGGRTRVTSVAAIIPLDALDNALVGGSSGAYPYASGLTYEVDAAKAKGSRVSMLKVNSRRAKTYTDIVDDTTYKVITNNYIAGGKDGYTTFSSINVKVDTYTEYAQGFINYLKTQSSIPAWDETHSSTQKFTNSSGVEHTTANCPSHLATAPSSRRAAHLDMSKCPAGNYSHQVKMTVRCELII